MFLRYSTRREVMRFIKKTVHSPDSTITQPDGTRVRTKDFETPVGEMPFLDEERILRRRLLYKVRVVYRNRGDGKRIITAYTPW